MFLYLLFCFVLIYCDSMTKAGGLLNHYGVRGIMTTPILSLNLEAFSLVDLIFKEQASGGGCFRLII
jgi:hypothetical protein